MCLIFQVCAQLFRPQVKTEGAQQVQDACAIVGRKISRQPAVNRVKSDSDRYGFSMAQAIVSQEFEPMRSPVPKIQRTRRALFERIAARYVIEMELRATDHK